MLKMIRANLADLRGWMKARAREWTSWTGAIVCAVASAAPAYAQFDPAIARAGFAAGVAMILLRQLPGASNDGGSHGNS